MNPHDDDGPPVLRLLYPIFEPLLDTRVALRIELTFSWAERFLAELVCDIVHIIVKLLEHISTFASKVAENRERMIADVSAALETKRSKQTPGSVVPFPERDR